MEFWGVEVKPGQSLKCEPGEEKYLHLSQACLGESKKDKGNVNVPVYVNVDGSKLVIGTLSPDKCAQISYDLVFEKEFELSHGWKEGSVFFAGYKTVISDEGPDEFSDTDSDDSTEVPQAIEIANGKALEKVAAKPTPKASSIGKQNALPSKEKSAEKLGKQKVESSDEDDSESDDDEDDLENEDDSDQEMGDGDDDEDESSDEEEKVTPKKSESGKKRPLDSESKPSASDKKAKLITPAKADGKKGGHVATPHPAKQAAKTPANEDKSKQQTPKSAGSVSCKSCSKTFNSDKALQSHTSAKHAAK